MPAAFSFSLAVPDQSGDDVDCEDCEAEAGKGYQSEHMLDRNAGSVVKKSETVCIWNISTSVFAEAFFYVRAPSISRYIMAYAGPAKTVK
jgi:hypothetical protein